MVASNAGAEMKELLTPNQVAKAIGVSESSLKRWADQGRIPFVRTAGGHRRLPIASVLEFVREQGLELVDATVLGLPAATGSGARTLDRGRTSLIEAFKAGSFEAAVRVVIDLYLVPYPLSEIFDRVIQPALVTVGDHWESGQMEVYEERRSVEFCARLLHELSTMQVRPDADAPLAIGGTLDGDPYTTASKMVELVLRSSGYRAVSCGNELPFETIFKAVENERPALFFLSISAIRDPAAFKTHLNQFFQHCEDHSTLLVVGGKAMEEPIRRDLRYHGFCDTMAQFESFARSHFPALKARNQADRANSGMNGVNGSATGNGSSHGNGKSNGKSNGTA